MNVIKWIEDLPKRGQVTFSLRDVENQFPHISKRNIHLSISRMKKKGRIYSAWRGFYVIITDEYALKGSVPPIEYIDSLMMHTGHKYYVGLLSAAAIYGAGHQQPQKLTVITESNDIRSNTKTPFLFFSKTALPNSHLIERNSGYGKVILSSPELTALDLVYYENSIGGLDRVVEIIGEMELDFKRIDDKILKVFKIPILQRLGFILEDVLGYIEIGEDFYSQIKKAGIVFRKSLLDPMNKLSLHDYSENKKWKIIVNCEIGADI